MFYSDVDENSIVDNNSENASVKLYEYVLFVKILVSIEFYVCIKFIQYKIYVLKII